MWQKTEYFVLCIECTVLIAEKWQIAISIQIFLFFRLILRKNYSFKFFYQGLNCRWCIFKCVFRWNSPCLCPVSWNDDKPNMQKVPIRFPILSIFKRLILWSYRLEFFGHCLDWDVFCQSSVFVKGFCGVCSIIFYAPGWRKMSQCDCACCFFCHGHDSWKVVCCMRK